MAKAQTNQTAERATLRTPELEAIIIEGLSDGVPLRQLARMNGFSKSAFYVWCKEDEELAGRIARARDLGFDAIAEEALEIADDGTNDWIKRERENGGVDDVINGEHVQRSKLRVDTRLKLLAKWDPKRYGDKQLIGSDPENPLPQGFTVHFGKRDEPAAD